MCGCCLNTLKTILMVILTTGGHQVTLRRMFVEWSYFLIVLRWNRNCSHIPGISIFTHSPVYCEQNRGKPLLQSPQKIETREPRRPSLMLSILSVRDHKNNISVWIFTLGKLTWATMNWPEIEHLSCIKNEWGHLDKKFKRTLPPFSLMFSLCLFLCCPF